MAFVAISGESTGALLVLDLTTPAHPQPLGRVALAGEASCVTVSGHHAYVGQSWWETNVQHNQLCVVDISNPQNPSVMSVRPASGQIGEIVVREPFAYLAGDDCGSEESGGGLEVIDISVPASPQRVALLTNVVGNGLTTSGNYAYATEDYWVAEWHNSLDVIDISDPTLPRRVGSLVTTSDPLRAPRTVAVSGNLACIDSAWTDGAQSRWGVLMIDVSDPTNPVAVGRWETEGEQIDDVALSGSYAYAAGMQGGLWVIDFSNPANPRVAGRCDTVSVKGSGERSSIAVWGKCAYVGATHDYDTGDGFERLAVAVVVIELQHLAWQPAS